MAASEQPLPSQGNMITADPRASTVAGPVGSNGAGAELRVARRGVHALAPGRAYKYK